MTPPPTPEDKLAIAVFNAITLHGPSELVFSQRVRIAQVMLNAMNTEVEIIKAEMESRIGRTPK